MTAQRRGARREHQAAVAFGTVRVHRSRFEKAPDVVPVRLADGTTLVVECKTRKRLPHLVMGALAQAANYLPGCTPVAVVSQTGGRAIAAMYLDDLVRVLGIKPSEPANQAVLPFGRSV